MAGAFSVLPPLSTTWPPDPLHEPQFYRDVTSRRVFAFVIDLMIVAMASIVAYMALIMVTVMTLGLAAPLFILFAHPILGLAYHVVLLASPASGTLGMRLMGLRAWSVAGGRPNGFQAVVHGVCYYGSMAVTSGLICLVALFNARRLTLHDMLAGVVVLRDI
ncbi:MAG TPA: RDD family protein [Magnetospirillaceae bacterium]|jgi:uncharacterized RDD family membrane protein YckC